MKLELKRTNDAELRARELKLREDLEGAIGEVPLSLERLRVLAEAGWLIPPLSISRIVFNGRGRRFSATISGGSRISRMCKLRF